MTTRAEQARLFNQAIAQGLSEEQALAAAGITDPNEFTYAFGSGQLEPAPLGPPARPNEVIVPPGTIRDDDDDAIFSGPGATTTSQTTTTGGSVTTTRVTPTTYRDTNESRVLSAEANDLQSQKEARSAELRAQGKSGAEVLRDPEYRALSQAQQSKQNAAQAARAVDQAGDVAVTTTPGPSETVNQRTPDNQYVTNDTTGVDPYANTSEIDQEAANPATYGPGAVSDMGFVPEDDPQANQFVFDENGELVPADSAEAQQILASQTRVENFGPEPVTVYASYQNPETGQWEVQNLQTGEVVASGLSEASAQRFATEANQQGIDSARQEFQDTTAADQDAEVREATAQAEARLRAQAQATFQKWRKQANDGDWRVRLRLAPNATYLYKSDAPGILQPLAVTDGVVFPYTPRITTAYRANYSDYKLTHSNVRGFFYQSSNVEDLNIEATFTAQDTYEAEYLLAVIHFFRSVTKMFYGANDPLAGAPPPLVYLQGFGEYQYNLHPCVVAQFNYNLPNDVDYIRARSKNISTNTASQYLNRRQRQDLPTNPFSSAWSRINNVLKPQGVQKGAVPTPPAPPSLGVGDSLNNNPTYVPTRIDVSLILHPIQSRQQVSREFNMQNFANGNLLRGGFW